MQFTFFEQNVKVLSSYVYHRLYFTHTLKNSQRNQRQIILLGSDIIIPPLYLGSGSDADDGVKSGAEVYKQDPLISPWSVQTLQDELQSHVECIIHVCSVDKLQGVQ